MGDNPQRSDTHRGSAPLIAQNEDFKASRLSITANCAINLTASSLSYSMKGISFKVKNSKWMLNVQSDQQKKTHQELTFHSGFYFLFWNDMWHIEAWLLVFWPLGRWCQVSYTPLHTTLTVINKGQRTDLRPAAEGRVLFVRSFRPGYGSCAQEAEGLDLGWMSVSFTIRCML